MIANTKGTPRTNTTNNQSTISRPDTGREALASLITRKPTEENSALGSLLKLGSDPLEIPQILDEFEGRRGSDWDGERLVVWVGLVVLGL
jgi:hypothetical protein